MSEGQRGRAKITSQVSGPRGVISGLNERLLDIWTTGPVKLATAG